MAHDTLDSSRVRTLSVIYLTLGSKRINQIVSFCGSLVLSVRKTPTNWEICTLQKNAKKLITKIIAFFQKEKVTHCTDNGDSRILIPHKDVLAKPTIRKLGLSATAIGLVFKECAEKVSRDLAPIIAEEDKAFLKWDIMLDELLEKFKEKKQFTAKKWLEMTVPTTRYTEI